MSKVSISRKHNLGHEKLVDEVEELARWLVDKYGGEYRWDGDQVIYRYSGVTACVRCAEDHVNVDLTFGMLMSMMKGPITREVENYLDNHLS